MTQKLDAWKIFLKARILQEEGSAQNNKDKISQALSQIEAALKMDPGNSSFENARKVAKKQLNQPDGDFTHEDQLLTYIESEYRDAAQKYIGQRDKPKLWINELTKLEREANNSDTAVELATLPMVW